MLYILAEEIPWLPAQILVYVAAGATAITAIAKFPVLRRPFSWLWKTVVVKPLATWRESFVVPVVMQTLNDTNGVSIYAKLDALGDGQGTLHGLLEKLASDSDNTNQAIRNIHECIDRRFTETHAMMDKLSLFTEAVLSEATGTRERVRQLYRSLDIPIFETDARGYCTYINPAFTRLTGLLPEDALGEGWIEALHPDDRGRVFKAWDSAVSSTIDFNALYRFCNVQTKEVTDVKGSARPLHDGKGVVVGYIGTFDPVVG